MSNRRTFLGRALGAGAALFAVRGLSGQMPMPVTPTRPGNQNNDGVNFTSGIHSPPSSPPM